ncbi:MAG: LptF/LptG family permease [Candidatus Kapabacteria bacterium]|nr:LptF/LptG family permease [Ignavibacteriota bacterium]MCW5885742.1 LptF/LptG family permease [Candidatus Kapabacteria bacterium]
MNLIDRYIAKQFIFTFVFGIIALCTIFVVVNLLENLDNFLDQKATTIVIIKYYIYYLPEIIKLLTPISTLIATLFTVGRLSTLNEITAMKSGGMSLYRLMLPLLLMAVMLSFLQLYFNGWVVPVANEYKKQIEQKYLSKSNLGNSIYNLYLRDTPTRNIIMQYYDSQMMQGNRVSIEDFSSEESPRLISRIEANTVTWDTVSHKWIGAKIIKRDYNESGLTTVSIDTAEIPIRLRHRDIEQLRRDPKEMNFDDLWNYIRILKMGGKDVRKQLIEYYGGWAFPFANLIVILFGVPFASVRRKGGIAIQIGAAMVISFAYMIFTEVSKTIAYAYSLDPILSGWIANLIFLVAGLITIFKTKT